MKLEESEDHDPLEVLIDSGGTDVHHPYAAFNQGFDAFDRGYPVECNPYTEDRESRWWVMGWEEAKAQDEEAEESNELF
jgi:ribosome modulation factor